MTKMTQNQINDLVQSAAINSAMHHSLRFGQTLMLILFDTDNDAYNAVVSNSNRVDPFYDDTKIIVFLDFLLTNK